MSDNDERRINVRNAVARHRAKKSDALTVISVIPSNHNAEAEVEAEAKAEGKEKRPPKASHDTGKAAHIVTAILAAAELHPSPSDAGRRIIRPARVQMLGDDVFSAYMAVGGMERFLTATGKERSFLNGEFAKALAAVKQ